MSFKPGESGNPKGRPIGSENKLTKKAKYYAEKIFEEFDKIGIDNLTQKGDIKDLLTLIRACLPKEVKAEVDTKITTTQPIKIEFED